jgi:hypothetical protein
MYNSVHYSINLYHSGCDVSDVVIIGGAGVGNDDVFDVFCLVVRVDRWCVIAFF